MTKVYNENDDLISDIEMSDLVSRIGVCFLNGNSHTPYLVSPARNLSTSTLTLTVDTLYCLPIIVQKLTTFTKIGIAVTTGGAGSTIRLGLYKNDGIGGYPGSLILDAGTVDSSVVAELSIDIIQKLMGKYWIVCITNATAPVCRRPSSASALNGGHMLGYTAINSASIVAPSSLTIASVSGYHDALPVSLRNDTFSAETSVSASPTIFLQV